MPTARYALVLRVFRGWRFYLLEGPISLHLFGTKSLKPLPAIAYSFVQQALL